MNAIGYTLLSVLTRGNFSGYDMMRQIESLRAAKHSQIYPLLAKMEKEGLVNFEIINQTSKPDKKVYSITEKGINALKNWINTPSNEPPVRDELTMKIYSMWITDRDKAKNLFINRISTYEDKLERYKIKIAKLEAENSNSDLMNPVFIHILLLQRAITQTEQEINWCKSVLKLFEEKNF